MRCLLSGAAVEERFVLVFPDFIVDFDGLVGDNGVDGIRLMLDTADALHCTTVMGCENHQQMQVRVCCHTRAVQLLFCLVVNDGQALLPGK